MAKTQAKVYVVSNSLNDIPGPYLFAWMSQRFDTIPSNYQDADIVVFPGGSDWNPELYGEKKIPETWYNDGIDNHQMGIMKKCLEDKKFMIGICRGAQGGCILAGGKLIQDFKAHSSPHKCVARKSTGSTEGVIFDVNSLHHQMMFPYNLDKSKYTVLAWSTQDVRKTINTKYIGESGDYEIDGVKLQDMQDFMEPEVVYFKEIGHLGIQCHPEMMNNSPLYKEAIDLFSKWANIYFNVFQKSNSKIERD